MHDIKDDVSGPENEILKIFNMLLGMYIVTYYGFHYCHMLNTYLKKKKMM